MLYDTTSTLLLWLHPKSRPLFHSIQHRTPYQLEKLVMVAASRMAATLWTSTLCWKPSDSMPKAPTKCDTDTRSMSQICLSPPLLPPRSPQFRRNPCQTLHRRWSPIQSLRTWCLQHFRWIFVEKNNAGGSVPHTVIATIPFDAIPKLEMAQCEPRRCCSVKRVSKVHVGYCPVHGPS